jgi:hypothetical protein
VGKETGIYASPQDILNRHLRLLTTNIDEMTDEECNFIAALYEVINFASGSRSVPLVRYLKTQWDECPKGTSRTLLKYAQIKCKEFFAQLEARHRAASDFKQGIRSISSEDVSPIKFTEDKVITISFKVGIDDLVLQVKEETPPLDQNYVFNLLKAFQVLDGRRFDEVIKTCPHCGTYFANLTGHKKTYCSRKCAMLANVKDKKTRNPELERRRQNIRTHMTLLKKQGIKDVALRSRLTAYIKERKYKEEEIPAYIADFIKGKTTEGKKTRKRKKGE